MHPDQLKFTSNARDVMTVGVPGTWYKESPARVDGIRTGGPIAVSESSALRMVRERAARRRAEEERLFLLEREQAAVAELRREVTQKTRILENMLDAVIVTDSEGRYVMVNEAAGHLLGMDPSDMIGLGLAEQPWKTFDEAGEALEHNQRPFVRALHGERASMIQRIETVDDEPALVTMLARLLSSDGHQIAVATSGEEALTVLAGTPTDVVISDLGMGAGMNGWDLAAAVRELPGQPHFILTTGWGAEIEPDEARARGVLAVVSKPYRLPDLRKILNTL